MLRRAFALCALMVTALLPVTALAGSTIYFEPRADGGWRISTPGEDYVVVPTGGGSYWTGTEREYTDAKVQAWSADHGFRTSAVGRNTFVLKATKRVYLPSLTIDGVATLIDPSDLKVDINWTQTRPVQVAMYLLDQRTRKVYKPVDLDTSQPPFHNETFRLPKATLRDPMLMFFFASRTETGVVGIPSLTRHTYDLTTESLHVLPGAKGVGNERDERLLAALRALDPSLPRR